MLTTTRFVDLARMQMRSLGDDDLALIVVEHPIGGIDAAELAERSAEAAAQAARWFGEQVGRPPE